MSRRSPGRDDHEVTASPELTRLIFLAMGMAVLIGLLCGVIWVAYHLVQNWLTNSVARERARESQAALAHPEAALSIARQVLDAITAPVAYRA